MEVTTATWEAVVVAVEEEERDEAALIQRRRLFDDHRTAAPAADTGKAKLKQKHYNVTEVESDYEEEDRKYISCCNEASSVEVVISNSDDGRFMEATEQINSRSYRRQEVLKSMVACGLTESTTSLSIVTAAATAQISNENIVVLALTNLIAGLFVIRHNLAGRKKKTLNRGCKNYKEVMVEGMHWLLHYSMAFISFSFFGLVPPLVYAFTFRESIDNKVLKLGAVAAASFPCIAFLAISRTHLQKPKKWRTYFKNIAYYVSIGVVAFGLSYLAGDLLGELIGKHGWFE